MMNGFIVPEDTNFLFSEDKEDYSVDEIYKIIFSFNFLTKMEKEIRKTPNKDIPQFRFTTLSAKKFWKFILGFQNRGEKKSNSTLRICPTASIS